MNTENLTFNAGPLRLFTNVFNHAYPLDLSIQKLCGQGCPYCFSQINKRAQKDVTGKAEDSTDLFLRKLQKVHGQGYNPLSISEYMIKQRYPIIFSNNTDPFFPASEAKYKIGQRVLRGCLEHDQPLFIQTKEVYPNDTIKKMIIDGNDIFNMYVSLSTLDLEKAAKYDTAKVTPKQRLDRITELAKAGVKVTVALNPYVSEWQPDLRTYFKTIAETGAVGIYTDPLHFTTTQRKFLTPIMNDYKDRPVRWSEFFDDVLVMEELAKEYGIKLHYQSRMPDDFYNGNAAELDAWPFNGFYLIQQIHSIYEESNAEKALVITWPLIDQFYSQFDGWNKIFKIDEFSGVLWLSTEVWKDVSAALGKQNKLKNIIRYVYNNTGNVNLYKNHFLKYWCKRLVEVNETSGEVTEIVDNENGDLIYIYHPAYEYPDDEEIDINEIELQEFTWGD